MKAFQTMIKKKEVERLDQIYADDADVVLIDRTITDNNVYAMFNGVGSLVITTEYDLVFLFTEPFKQTTTEWFTHYNDERLNDLFKKVIGERYNPVVVSNGSEYEKIKEVISDTIESKTSKHLEQ